MGQYYDIIIKKNTCRHYDRSVDGEFVSAKLTAHSWWDNKCLAAICRMLYNSPANVYWVGDYANMAAMVNGMTKEETMQIYRKCYGKNALKRRTLDGGTPLSLDGLYLVNHTRKEYIDCSKFFENGVNGDGSCLHPLPLMTAIGNGLGGGDYHGTNQNRVGEWAGDLLSVSDVMPDDFTANDVCFTENWEW